MPKYEVRIKLETFLVAYVDAQDEAEIRRRLKTTMDAKVLQAHIVLTDNNSTVYSIDKKKEDQQ